MKTITAQTLFSRLETGPEVLLVDVLEEEQFMQAHIPGSYNVPRERDDFVDAVGRLLGAKSRPVVVYGDARGSPAAPEAGQKLTEAGFSNVTHFAGGMAEWQRRTFPVETGAPSHAH